MKPRPCSQDHNQLAQSCAFLVFDLYPQNYRLLPARIHACMHTCTHTHTHIYVSEVMALKQGFKLMPRHWQKPSTGKVDVQSSNCRVTWRTPKWSGCRMETDPMKGRNGDVLCDNDDEQVSSLHLMMRPKCPQTPIIYYALLPISHKFSRNHWLYMCSFVSRNWCPHRGIVTADVTTVSELVDVSPLSVLMLTQLMN